MRDARHDNYDEAMADLNFAIANIRMLLEEEPSCEWEVNEALKEIGLARRYMSKVGERLFCNWSGCSEEDEALSKGEGVPYFKGLVHPECLEKINANYNKSKAGT